MNWLGKLLGLCAHEWKHASNFISWGGPVEVLICDKCLCLRHKPWKVK